MAGHAPSIRRLYIIGAQSTGKTTIINALEEESKSAEATSVSNGCSTKPLFIREVARKTLEEKHITRDDLKTSPQRAFEAQKHILDAQFAAEEAAIGLDFISDRSGLDPIVYAQVLVGEDAAQEMLTSKPWKKLEAQMKSSIVILCEAGCKWLTDDGTRLMPEDPESWMRIDNAFRELLAARSIPYTVISREMISLADRIQFVKDKMNR